MTSFGPQLIGETEKTLNALLRHVLAGSDLTEPQWVTLRLAAQHDGHSSLADVIAERAHLDDARDLVAVLDHRGLLDGNRASAAGTDLVTALRARIDDLTAPIWADLPVEDVRAADRVLNLVVERARSVLHDQR